MKRSRYGILCGFVGSDSILVMNMAGMDDEVFPFELKVPPDFHCSSSFQLHFNCKVVKL